MNLWIKKYVGTIMNNMNDNVIFDKNLRYYIIYILYRHTIVALNKEKILCQHNFWQPNEYIY